MSEAGRIEWDGGAVMTIQEKLAVGYAVECPICGNKDAALVDGESADPGWLECLGVVASAATSPDALEICGMVFYPADQRPDATQPMATVTSGGLECR
jgi:hypothetical protein